jgi:hypothetical protein
MTQCFEEEHNAIAPRSSSAFSTAQKGSSALGGQNYIGGDNCFALVLADDTDESMLLTGDARLRTLAEDNDVEAHGVLWITDELEEHGIVAAQRLHDSLCLLRDDVLVFLPEDELVRRIRRLADLL